MEPRIEVISYNLPDEKTALYVETALIELLGITKRFDDAPRASLSLKRRNN